MQEPSFPQNLYNSVYVDGNKFDNYDSFATFGDFPTSLTAVIDRIYYAQDTDIHYRWNGTTYNVLISAGGGVPALSTLTDVNVTGLQSTDVLSWNGATEWIPAKITSEVDITSTLLLNCDMNALFTANTTVNDTSVYNSVGTLNGGLSVASLVAGKISNGILFTGATDIINFNTTAGQLNFTQNQEFSVSMWFKSTLNDSTNRVLCGKGVGNNGEGWWILYQSDIGRIVFKMADSTSSRNLEIRWDLGALAMNDNAFHHIVITKKAGVDSGDVNLYFDNVNRVNDRFAVTETLLTTDIITTTTAFSIGKLISGYQSCRGTIDQVSIFNYELCVSNVKSIYNNNVGTETYTNVLTVVDHKHFISDVIDLQPTLDSKLEEVVSAHSGVINVSGTGTTRVIEPRIGCNIPPLYSVNSFNDGSKLSFDAGTMSTVTSIEIGWLPVNRSIYQSNYIKYVHEIVLQRLPCTLYLVDANNENNRALFDVLSYTTGATSHDLTVQNVSVSGTPPTTNNSTSYHAILTHKLPAPINEALYKKNYIENGQVKVYNFGSPQVVPTITYNAFNCPIIQQNNALGFNTQIVMSSGMHVNALSYNTPRSRFVSIQLTGSSWIGVNCNDIFFGIAGQNSFDTVQNWNTATTVISELVPWGNATSQERIHRGAFDGVGHIWAYSGAIIPGSTRYGDLTKTLFAVGDILVYYMNLNHQFQIVLYDSAGIAVSGAFINSPDGLSFSSNFLNQSIMPSFSTNMKGAGYEITIMNQRMCDSIPMVVSDAENLFY